MGFVAILDIIALSGMIILFVGGSSNRTLFVFLPAQAIVAQHIRSFQEFPPRQRPGSFSVNQAMEMLMKQKGSN